MSKESSIKREQEKRPILTFDILVLLVTDVSSDIHRVADQRVPTRMLHRVLVQSVEFDHVDRQSSASGKVSVLVVRRFDLDRVQRQEGRLA